MESHFGLFRLIKAGVRQHVQNKTGRWGEKRKRDHTVDLPAKVEIHGRNTSASHQHQAAHREVPGQGRKLPPKLSQIDLQTSEKKKRRDAKGREVGDDAVMNERLKKAGDDNAKGKTSERSGKPEALQRTWNDEQSEDHSQVNKGGLCSLHSHSGWFGVQGEKGRP